MTKDQLHQLPALLLLEIEQIGVNRRFFLNVTLLIFDRDATLASGFDLYGSVPSKHITLAYCRKRYGFNPLHASYALSFSLRPSMLSNCFSVIKSLALLSTHAAPLEKGLYLRADKA